MLKSREEAAVVSDVFVTTKGAVSVMLLANGILMSLGLARRYAAMSCVNRHLEMEQDYAMSIEKR